MQPGRNPDDRFLTLLQVVSQLDGAEEKRSFLEGVCDGEPTLLAELLETASLGEKQHNLWFALAGEPAGAGDAFGAGQRVADRFQIVRKLGEGGMAEVYEAVDLKLNERRALKFPKPGFSQTMSPEARSALRVTHDNICRIHEIHTTATDSGPADFISMEFLEGETLLSRWRREAIPGAEALEIAGQLCLGLDAAHNAHILHRDLKSNNVMLTRHADGSLRVVITDFGLARPLGGGRGPASATVSGTPNYIAPERLKGAAATPGSDVYGLGVILYEMLAGRLPFRSGTPWQKRLRELPEPPSRSERAPDARWDPIVLRCLDPDPEKRFSSARQVLRAIEHAFRVSHRRKWLAAAAAVALVAIPVGAWRDRIWPAPPLARLAILPFAGSAPGRGVDEAVRGGLYDLAGRLESLGASSRRLVVIPLEDSLRYEVNSPAAAAARLGATHALSGTIGARNQGVAVRAAVTDLRSGETVRAFSGEFQAGDLASLSTSLAAVVTAAFHLKKAPPATILPAAYQQYAEGLASLHRGPAGNEQAIGSFQEALKLDSRSALIHAGLAEAFLGKFTATNDAQWLKEASASARRADSLHPDSPPVLLVSGRIEHAEGRPERAIELFRRAVELEPNNAEVWRRAGQAFQRVERHGEATEALRKAIQLAPGYYGPHMTLGFVHFRMGRYAEAEQAYRAVTQLAPELPDGYSYLGGALLALEKEAEAEQALLRSLQLRETRAALNNLGVLLRYQRRDSEAVEVLERALQAGADDSALRLNLGNALRRTGRVNESRENFQRASDLARAALRRDPRDAAARARLAYSMVQLGMRGLAADEALQAARLAASDYSVLFWSVMALDSLGRRQDAFPLLANATHEQLRDLRRQPDLADFSRDPRFLAIVEQSQTSQTKQERKK